MPPEVNVVIIGAGIVGLSIALEILERSPHLSLVVLEKDSAVGLHQTGHNSGVVHSGIYYKPGSLKASLCAEGARSLLHFCERHGVPYKRCGKIIVATSTMETKRLDDLFERGLANGMKGLRRINSDQIREIEPYAAGIQGIHVPETAIIDYRVVAEKYAELICQRGGEIRFNTEVIDIQRCSDRITVVSRSSEISSRLVINCGGLHSDRIARMTHTDRDVIIVPFRGEYYEISPEKQYMVKGLIYPVPDPRFPFLGAHFTRRISGGVEAGPNAVLAFKREGYSKQSISLQDIIGFAAFPGFWKMASAHWRMSLSEYHRSWSKKAFVRELQRLLPDLQENDLIPGGSGVRAQALDRNGKLIDDFRFLFQKGIVNVLNVPSPAATASLAIGKYVVDTLIREMGIL
jgi:L-2-hydroxyglutarate oxidase